MKSNASFIVAGTLLGCLLGLAATSPVLGLIGWLVQAISGKGAGAGFISPFMNPWAYVIVGAVGGVAGLEFARGCMIQRKSLEGPVGQMKSDRHIKS